MQWMALVMSVMISGCASSPVPEKEPSSRYTISQDRAPGGDFDASGLVDAKPRYEAPRSAGNKSTYTVWGKQYHVIDSNDGYVERGTASWYGEKFHGHKTSNGEVFDMYTMTAAHKSLRIPGYARVTNLDNGRSVVVRVNDRGPFHGDRLIDLSYAAAKKLGYQGKGTARVEVAAISVAKNGTMTLAGKPFPGGGETVPVEQIADNPQSSGKDSALFVQLGSFSSRSPAEILLGKARDAIADPMRVRAVDTASGRFHRVQVGPFSNPDEAKQAQARLENRGFGQTILLTDSH
ncbi:septal ring lytic transglycosylase RlpA family protein [Marinobacter sp.]|uniref:septal ring lytic transglycosylase RlpA family protein n=1 Tax=Marinobacter sp. TaxID=50741 RepID=UPI0034A1DD92